LGCTDLRCPSTSRARTQQHTWRTACTSTRIAAAAAAEGCMHACVVHSCASYMVRHAFNCWPLSNPSQAKGWCDDGRVSTCKAGISRHHNTLQWQHTCCRLRARSVSRMRPFLKAPSMCHTPRLIYLRTHAWHHDGRGGGAQTTQARGECNATHSEYTAHPEPHVLRR
jgi:hypothetical protein